MRNQLAQAVLRATSPLVLPLRRVFPPVSRVDSASVVALLIVQFLTVLVILLLGKQFLYPSITLTPMVLAFETALELVREVLRVYGFGLFIYALLSWVAPHTYSPTNDILGALCDPILKRIRRLIPPLAGLDFSVFFACIGISAIFIALPGSPFPFG
jgi:YggT family protein